jgi:hypothetical protein
MQKENRAAIKKENKSQIMQLATKREKSVP